MDAVCNLENIGPSNIHRAIAVQAIQSTHNWELFDELDNLLYIERMVKTIITTDKAAFTWMRDKRGRIILKESRLALYFNLVKSAANYLIQQQYPEQNISLHADAFFAALHQQGFLYNKPNNPCGDDLYEADLFNQLLHDIRHRCSSPDFQNELRQRGELATRMYFGMVGCARRLIKRHRKLLVIRLDFYLPPSIAHSTAESAKAHLKHFLDNRRGNPGIFRHGVGYIWKLEHGADRGFHFHCVFFLNGSTAKGNGVYWGNQYGAYWKSRFPSGDAGFHNCNQEKFEKAQKGQYRQARIGVGKLIYHDTRKRQHLYDALAYLAKKEQLLPLKSKWGNVWSCGEVPPGEKPGPERRQ
ncbi:YagK/YfjJ domain-containing protein [Chitinimonas sp. JJ19]|uniref:YagK/YfjJ domain-containing protein n=1 Tax=Chitinimonas sp. JJ19 TaxID=3109352 RepID=UPI003001DF55